LLHTADAFSTGVPVEPVPEFKRMIKVLPNAGLELILVVHHQERFFDEPNRPPQGRTFAGSALNAARRERVPSTAVEEG
jgi:hypothetical protein